MFENITIAIALILAFGIWIVLQLGARVPRDRKRIIVFGGAAGSGKDTAVGLLAEMAGFTRLAFADILKDMVSAETGIPRSWFDERDKKDRPLRELYAAGRKILSLASDLTERVSHAYPDNDFWTGLQRMVRWGVQLQDHKSEISELSPRQILIAMAKQKREHDNMVFVRPVLARIRNDPDRYKKWAIADGGWLEEVDAIRDAFPGEGFALWTDRGGAYLDDGRTLRPEDCDLILSNNGSISQLRDKLRRVFG